MKKKDNFSSKVMQHSVKKLSIALLASMLTSVPILPTLAQAPSGGSPAPASTNSSGSSTSDVPSTYSEPLGGFNTAELTALTLEQLPDCLEYKITGISLRLIIIPPFYYEYFWTPHVEHYSPDMVSMSHVELEQIPWIEVRNLFGQVYKQIAQTLFASVISKLFGMGGDTEIAGGRYRHEKWIDHQSVNFMENLVLGNPVAMFLDMFTFDGKRMAQNTMGGGGGGSSGQDNYGVGTGIGTGSRDSDSGSGGGSGGKFGGSPKFSGKAGNNQERPQVSEKQFSSWMTAWVTNPDGTEWPTLFSDSMGYQQAMTMMANSPIVQVVKQIMQQIDAVLSGVNGKVGDSPFCPVNATPFEPYYLSGIDAYLWRLGFPIADNENALTVLNPFSGDTIKPTNWKEKYGDALVDLPDEVMKILTPRWGNIYPREGAVTDPNTARGGTVVAKRGQTLLGEKEKGLGRIYKVPKYRVRSAAWSGVYPEAKSCHRNIANIVNEEKMEKNGMYGWTMWTSHDCDLYRKGIHIVTIPIGPIYVTPQIPE